MMVALWSLVLIESKLSALCASGFVRKLSLNRIKLVSNDSPARSVLLLDFDGEIM